MRKTMIAIFAGAASLTAFGMAAPEPANAQSAYSYRWCAQYSGRSSGTNCYFQTRAQCQATVSGVGGFCQPNPFYAHAQYEPRQTKYRHRHY